MIIQSLQPKEDADTGAFQNPFAIVPGTVLHTSGTHTPPTCKPTDVQPSLHTCRPFRLSALRVQERQRERLRCISKSVKLVAHKHTYIVDRVSQFWAASNTRSFKVFLCANNKFALCRGTQLELVLTE
jgi:hypothetical protein